MASALARRSSMLYPLEAPVSTRTLKGWPGHGSLGVFGQGARDGLDRTGGAETAKRDGVAVSDQGHRLLGG